MIHFVFLFLFFVVFFFSVGKRLDYEPTMVSTTTTFDDIKGLDEVVAELKEILRYVESPEVKSHVKSVW